MGFSNGHLLLTVGNHLTLLSELLDGVYVGLLRNLPLCFLDVVQVQSWRWGCKTWGGLVSDGGKRGEGRHGRQGAHVSEGGCHRSRCHTRHGGTHGDV